MATVQVTAASGLKATDSLRVTAYLPAAAPLPAASSTLAIDAVRGVAWVPVPEADAVAAIDLATRSRTMVPVCDGPRSVAVDGSRGLVACEEDDTLVVLDLETRAVSGDGARSRNWLRSGCWFMPATDQTLSPLARR